MFPKRTDGSGLPTYVAADATYTQPYLRGGGQAIMSGPTYHRSLVDTTSGVAWPEYWDGKWFIGDQSNAANRVAVTVDPAGVPQAAPPVYAESLRAIIPGGNGDNRLQSWMDAKFGPDGALYLLDYGGGFFSLHANQKLIRVTYTGGAPDPGAGGDLGRRAEQAPDHRLHRLPLRRRQPPRGSSATAPRRPRRTPGTRTPRSAPTPRS